MATKDMSLIQTVTVGAGGASSIDFNSIPQTYTDLQIVISARSSRTSDFRDDHCIRFNGNTGNNYTVRNLNAISNSIGTGTDTSTSFFRMTMPSNAGTVTSNTFGNSSIYIPNYTSSNQKSISTDNVMENNSTTNWALTMTAGLWTQTAAITSISIFPEIGSYMQYSTATLYGITSTEVITKATGGTVYSDSDYVYHVFRTSGTFTPTSNLSADVLVLGGGGGGGGTSGGGGGAGGLIHGTSLALTANTNYTATVGAGGPLTPGQNGANGVNSSFNSRVGVGGGGGGTSAVNTNGVAGGCGGAGSGYGGSKLGGASTQGSSGGTGYGFAGGNGDDGEYRGGGGGGTGQVGYSSSASQPGIGGNGTYLFASWLNATGTGVNGYIGGGGGGGGYYSGNPATGGLGGGGTGSNRTGGGTAGIVNCGGGGGGSSDTSNNGTNGSSGVVIVRYAI